MIPRPIHGVGHGRYDLFTKPFLDELAEFIPWAFQVLCHHGHGLFVPVMITYGWGPMGPFFPTESGVCSCPVVSAAARSRGLLGNWLTVIPL